MYFPKKREFEQSFNRYWSILQLDTILILYLNF